MLINAHLLLPELRPVMGRMVAERRRESRLIARQAEEPSSRNDGHSTDGIASTIRIHGARFRVLSFPRLIVVKEQLNRPNDQATLYAQLWRTPEARP